MLRSISEATAIRPNPPLKKEGVFQKEKAVLTLIKTAFCNTARRGFMRG
jgi:hypothetical protein